jgi:hypothetical protein
VADEDVYDSRKDRIELIAGFWKNQRNRKLDTCRSRDDTSGLGSSSGRCFGPSFISMAFQQYRIAPPMAIVFVFALRLMYSAS